MNEFKRTDEFVKMAKKAIENADVELFQRVSDSAKKLNVGLCASYCIGIAPFIYTGSDSIKKAYEPKAFDDIIYKSKDATAIYMYAKDAYNANYYGAVSALIHLRKMGLADQLQAEMAVNKKVVGPAEDSTLTNSNAKLIVCAEQDDLNEKNY